MKRILCTALLLLASAPLLAESPLPEARDRLVLNDGSVVAGELLGFDGDTYTFRSDSLGTLELAAERVARLYTRGSDSAAAGEANGFLPPPAVALGDGDSSDEPMGPLDMLLQLQRDPQIRVVVEDMLAITALASGDTDAVLRSPKLMKLFDDPLTRMVVLRILEETRKDIFAESDEEEDQDPDSRAN